MLTTKLPTDPRFINVMGQKFGRLLVTGYAGRFGRQRKHKWVCRCDCGKVVEVISYGLRKGRAKSCGCLCVDVTRKRSTIHGFAKRGQDQRTYSAWCAMKARCDSKNPSFERYGLRGINVCERWSGSFANFLADMGECPDGMTLDRIDNNRGYSPENCRWANLREQARNTRRNRQITMQGETRCLTEWCELLGVSPGLVYSRLKTGWGYEQAFGLIPREPRDRRRRKNEREHLDCGSGI